MLVTGMSWHLARVQRFGQGLDAGCHDEHSCRKEKRCTSTNASLLAIHGRNAMSEDRELSGLSVQVGVNASSRAILERLVRADTASAFNISVGDVKVTGVTQVRFSLPGRGCVDVNAGVWSAVRMCCSPTCSCGP